MTTTTTTTTTTSATTMRRRRGRRRRRSTGSATVHAEAHCRFLEPSDYALHLNFPGKDTSKLWWPGSETKAWSKVIRRSDLLDGARAESEMSLFGHVVTRPRQDPTRNACCGTVRSSCLASWLAGQGLPEVARRGAAQPPDGAAIAEWRKAMVGDRYN